MWFSRWRSPRHLLYLFIGASLIAALIVVSQLSIVGAGYGYIRGITTNRALQPPPAIPRILHQTWDTELVPAAFRAWMATWRSLHPDWQFWFWTEADVRRLLRAHYPGYERLYDGYEQSIFRADVMRYFVLHQYGGVYADLDVEALRPLDDLLVVPDCLLSRETYEHAYFLYHQAVPVVMTTIMAARPRHPFFAAVQKALRATAGNKNVLYATGPFFLNRVFLEYSRTNRSRARPDTLTVLEPNYLLPTFDRAMLRRIKQACGEFGRLELLRRPAPHRRRCQLHIANHWSNKPLNTSYTNHHWYHVMDKPASWKRSNTFHIDSLPPGRKNLVTLLQGH